MTDEYLSYADQAMFLMLRGAGQEPVIQALWLYHRPADLSGIQRLNRRLATGPFNRRIEVSPLPFGRHRWVRAAAVPLVVEAVPVDREKIYDWADGQVDLPLDPEHGPTWRLGVAPIEGGGAVVSLVVSHCIADGAAVNRALVAAMSGERSVDTFPVPRSRSRHRARVADLRRLRDDLPEIRRALRVGVRAWRDGREAAKVPAPRRRLPRAPGRTVHLATASLIGDVAAWDARAAESGGNRFARAAAVAAQLGCAVGRRQRGGDVMLLVPVSERGDDDHAVGNLVSLAHVPAPAVGQHGDLTRLRAALREGIAAARSGPDPMQALLPLIPFVPRRAIGGLANQALGLGTNLPVSVSNMGTLDPIVRDVDGSPADVVLYRGTDRRVTTTSLESRRGVLTVFAGVVGDQVTLTAVGWQPGTATTCAQLRQALMAGAAAVGVTWDEVV